jgi:FAD/FMN-containing dehydrogenase
MMIEFIAGLQVAQDAARMFTLFPLIGRDDPGWRLVLDAFDVAGQPAYVALPESDADLAELLDLARTRGMRIVRQCAGALEDAILVPTGP